MRIWLRSGANIMPPIGRGSKSVWARRPRERYINKIAAYLMMALASNPCLPKVRGMLNAIHHVALICTDYERSRRFYVELLGLDLIREVYREVRQSWKADLRIGSVQLELFSFPAPVMRPSHPEATGLRHLAFAVANLDPMIMRLEAAGVTVEPIRIDPYTDRRFTFFSDPDGLPLELYEAP